MNLEEQIKGNISTIQQFYNLDKLLAQKTDEKAIAKYYRASDFFYNLIHARGAQCIHLSLSDDGRFHKEDLLKQAQFVAENIDDSTREILEVGAGKLPNTRYLAERFPDRHFTALDLPHRNFLKTKAPENVRLVEGNFKDLSVFPEASFDLVFGIETVSYAEDKNHVIKEIKRVLKPGGKLIFFDAYEAQSREDMTEFERYAADVTFAAMRLTNQDQYYGNVANYMRENGFTDVEVADLTEKGRPSLRRLYRVSDYYFHHPLLARALKTFLPRDATMNSIAGYLMYLTFDGKTIHSYNRITGVRGND